MSKKYLGLLNELSKKISGEGVQEAIALLKEKVKEIPEEKSPEVTGLPLPKEVLNDMLSIAIFSDGACRGNPGPGAWGTLVQDNSGDVIYESSGVEVRTTNNKMELEGAINGLQFAFENHKTSSIYLYTDSKYVVDGMNSWVAGWKNRGWKKADKKVPENVEQWKTLDHLREQFSVVKFLWVKGHAGHPQNEHCDQLANQALDEAGF